VKFSVEPSPTARSDLTCMLAKQHATGLSTQRPWNLGPPLGWAFRSSSGARGVKIAGCSVKIALRSGAAWPVGVLTVTRVDDDEAVAGGAPAPK
jgi:hypothetical protein